MTRNEVEVAKKPSQVFYKELFDTKMFADVDIQYGQGHILKAHSTVLMPKSTWFAKQFDRHVDIQEEGPPPEIFALFEHFTLSPCRCRTDKADPAEHCLDFGFFQDMIRFCYTGEHPRPKIRKESVESVKMRCVLDIYMYYLGKRYGIESLSSRCASGFAKAMVAVRALQPEELIDMINLVYELPGLDKDDSLRKVAIQHAQEIADSSTTNIGQDLIQKEVYENIKTSMPRASEDLFNQGYKPKLPTFIPNTSFCVRCQSTLDPNQTPPSNKCKTCKSTPGKIVSIQVPDTFTTGLSLTVWQCQVCTTMWTSENIRTKTMRLEQCPTCATPEQKKKRKVGLVKWVCGSCHKVWTTWAPVLQQKPADMKVCICCSAGGDDGE